MYGASSGRLFVGQSHEIDDERPQSHKDNMNVYLHEVDRVLDPTASKIIEAVRPQRNINAFKHQTIGQLTQANASG